MQRTDSAAQQILHGGDELVGISRLRIERLPAREGEQAVSECSGTLRRAHRRLGIAPDMLRTALRNAGLHQVERADDARKEIVEIVGNSACQLPDRLHLLSLAKLLFGSQK